ncbi:MAG: hypothetical protein HFI08_02845 [Bacilli bacterium]|nr:hypothetical protein [Bacilli bacterium]
MITKSKMFDSIKYVVDNSKYVKINEKNIDNVLWLLSKNKELKDKPHHLTKTIYY